MNVRAAFLFVFTVMLSACVRVPEGVTPVNNFELDRYLGTWYEVARLDHSFERGLSRVSADYRLRDDGGVSVINRGYDAAKGEWKQADGKAFFVEEATTGYLKVSFFGPFYGAYVIVELDQENYQYSLVSGPDRDYLWLLARTPTPPRDVIDRLVARAKALGYPTDQLIYVTHDGATPEG